MSIDQWAYDRSTPNFPVFQVFKEFRGSDISCIGFRFSFSVFPFIFVGNCCFFLDKRRSFVLLFAARWALLCADPVDLIGPRNKCTILAGLTFCWQFLLGQLALSQITNRTHAWFKHVELPCWTKSGKWCVH